MTEMTAAKTSPSQAEKADAFRALHECDGAFVIPNPWNAGTAKALTSLGFEALATTSAGVGFALGRLDSGGAITREAILENAKEIVAATTLPVSADLENGFGDAPEACAQIIRDSLSIGLVGGSIEDATGRADTPIYDFDHAVERVAAAVEACTGQPFVLTARAENFLHGRPDLDDTIKRLQAFEKAGADVLYAPGLPSLEAIRTVCQSVSKPVNVVMGLQPPTFSVEELQDAGVKRISVGGSLARAAFDGFINAVEEIRDHGTFTYGGKVIKGGDIFKLIG